MNQGIDTMRSYGMRTVTVTQTLPESWKNYQRKNVAFEEWRKALKRGDRLPRGQFFKGKKAGSTPVILDEFWRGDFFQDAVSKELKDRTRANLFRPAATGKGKSLYLDEINNQKSKGE